MVFPRWKQVVSRTSHGGQQPKPINPSVCSLFYVMALAVYWRWHLAAR